MCPRLSVLYCARKIKEEFRRTEPRLISPIKYEKEQEKTNRKILQKGQGLKWAVMPV